MVRVFTSFPPRLINDWTKAARLLLIKSSNGIADEFDVVSSIKKRIGRASDTDIGCDSIHEDAKAAPELPYGPLGIWIGKHIKSLLFNDYLLK